MTAPGQLVHPRGLMVPRVYAHTGTGPPHLAVGCACGWTCELPDGALSIKVTQVATRHMITDHLGEMSALVDDAAESVIDAVDEATRPPAGR